MKLHTTLALLRKHHACSQDSSDAGYRKLKAFLGKWADDKPINLLTILESNGIDDMLWCLQATIEDSDKVSRLMAADFAESILHLYTTKYPNDDRPAKAIQAARDYANGKIDKNTLDAAWAAARAAWAAARDAAWAAAWAAWAAARAAWDATAGAAARDAARAAWDATAWAAARAAARTAAGVVGVVAEKRNQEIIIRNYLESENGD